MDKTRGTPAPAPPPASPPAPAGLLYTILRHARGLDHAAASRAQREHLLGPKRAA